VIEVAIARYGAPQHLRHGSLQLHTGRALAARRRSLVPGPRRRALLCLARTCIRPMRRSRWTRLPLIVTPLRRNSAVMRR
jgi:hypothetical protein